MDKYSVLHFMTGVLFRYLGFAFAPSLIVHILFEVLENTTQGMAFINRYFKDTWPGGKYIKDSFLNSMIGDNLFFALGWLACNALL